VDVFLMWNQTRSDGDYAKIFSTEELAIKAAYPIAKELFEDYSDIANEINEEVNAIIAKDNPTIDEQKLVIDRWNDYASEHMCDDWIEVTTYKVIESEKEYING
jgi:hypothetical protein